MIPRRFWRERIESAWKRRSVVWLSGVRRIGKTVLVRSLPRVEYFDCELPSVRQALENPERFLRSLGSRRVVLDEIHRLPNPSEVLKIAADHFPRLRVVATGSSTLAAGARFRDTLTGRKLDVRLTPMMSADLEAFGGSLERRLERGGLPPFFLANERVAADLREWLDSFWARDVLELFRLERRASFVRFVELLLARSGGVFEATSFAGPCEVSRPTIGNYLGVLEATQVAHVVRPYSSRRGVEVVKTPRVYALDTGFVAAYRGWKDLRPEDFGVLWEHYVLNEIHARLPGIEVRYWRDTRGHEVDFVVARPGRSPIAIECKWSSSAARDVPGLLAFRHAYPQGSNLLVTPDVQRPYELTVGHTDVHVVDLAGMVAHLAE